VGTAFLFDERAQVSFLLDALVAIEGAPVVGEYLRGHLRIDDAHALIGRHDGEIPLHVRVGDAVVVLVEAQVRRLPDPHFEPFLDRKLVRRERDHRRLVLEKSSGDRLLLLVEHPALARDLETPRARLHVQIVDGGEVASGEEIIADVLDRALDPPFFVRTVGRACTWLEAVVPLCRDTARWALMKAPGRAGDLQSGRCVQARRGGRIPPESRPG
jgi:hypothetical protein